MRKERLIQISDTGFAPSLPTHLTSNTGQATFVPKRLKQTSILTTTYLCKTLRYSWTDLHTVQNYH